jgi:hypothetical protein
MKVLQQIGIGLLALMVATAMAQSTNRVVKVFSNEQWTRCWRRSRCIRIRCWRRC